MNIEWNEHQDAFDGEEFLDLFCEPLQFNIEGVEVIIESIPILKNTSSGAIFLPDQSKQLINYAIEENKKRNKFKELRLGCVKNLLNLDAERYNSFCKDVPFLYSAMDYNFIPGLWRPWNKGFLTPVFFNINILDKYSRNPDYSLDLFSETYGSIFYKDKWSIEFGINRRKQIILWLGDIDKLPNSEQFFLKSENIKSEHDFHSEFYNAQIETKWSNPSQRNSLFKLRSDFKKQVQDKYHFEIFHLDGEVSKFIKNLDIPVFWEDKHVSPIIDSMNKILVESFNTKSIKEVLKSKFNISNDEIKKLASLKTFERWLEHEPRLDKESISRLLCPFYVLNDFRIIACHLCSDEGKPEKIKSIQERLSLEETSGNEDIYKTLINSLLKSYSELIKIIEG